MGEKFFSISMINVDKQLKRPSKTHRQSSNVLTSIVNLVNTEETQAVIDT